MIDPLDGAHTNVHIDTFASICVCRNQMHTHINWKNLYNIVNFREQHCKYLRYLLALFKHIRAVYAEYIAHILRTICMYVYVSLVFVSIFTCFQKQGSVSISVFVLYEYTNHTYITIFFCYEVVVLLLMLNVQYFQNNIDWWFIVNMVLAYARCLSHGVHLADLGTGYSKVCMQNM